MFCWDHCKLGNIYSCNEERNSHCDSHRNAVDENIERIDKEFVLKNNLEECKTLLNNIKFLLDTAERIGSLKDKPEGVRYIQISDTFAKEIIKMIDKVIK